MTDKKERAKLRVIPITLAEANTLVSNWHRHHKPLAQSKFCIGVCVQDDGRLCGAAIVGRPVARLLDDGLTLEVNRCVTDGTPNACSALYGAVARSAKAQGYCRVYTYTRVDEPGTSIKASGWILDDPEIRARSWNMPGRRRVDRTEVVGRKRWLWESGLTDISPVFPDVPAHDTGMRSLFAALGGQDE
jgi:hypothetical protein